VSDELVTLPEGTRLVIAFPLPLSPKVTHKVVLENLREQGFVRVHVNDVAYHLDDLAGAGIDLTRVSGFLVIVDRLSASESERSRIADAVEAAFRHGDGECSVVIGSDAAQTRVFTERCRCPNDGYAAPTPTPQLFSFNSPRGACEECNGFGAVLEYDEALIVPNVERSLRDGALDPWTKPRYEGRRRSLLEFARKEKIPADRAWRALSAAHRDLLLRARSRSYTGIFPFLEGLEAKRYKQYVRVFLRQYQSARECPTCRGARLTPAALDVKIAGETIAAASARSLEELRGWLDGLELGDFERAVAEHVLREAKDRVRFLNDVGLGYLTLDRAMRTLSGGEAQRIALANALGTRLVDTLYVLDEPSIGLHARDMDRLLALLVRLRDGGNTVLVVEHDLAAIRLADHMIELGPGSGERGGRVVFAGPLERAAESPLTGKYLSGEKRIPLPDERRRAGPRWLVVSGAREHNLKGIDVRIPLGTLSVVTGVSGSGKSTLVHDVLYRALEQRLTGDTTAKKHLGERVGAYERLTGWESISDVVLVDQSPIGRTPRSNPVTYIKAFDEIRRVFADLPLARQRRLTPSTFSFNVPGGRCDVCEGAGYLEIEMVFMADVFVPCDQCAGRRFKPEVLEVKLRGKSIHDVLQLTVDQAIRFFPYEEKLGQALWQLQQVGLGYLTLGQPATTLSGGEAQRVKIARELAQAARNGGRKLYIMDEPTTGLHLEDIRKLSDVLDRLVDAGHTVLLIEHNLDVIKRADWVVDLGPEAGGRGGEVVAIGTPEEIVRVPESHTGRWLKPLLTRQESAVAS
ncbi:MAG: excinuclease ABC subunit UvrA, partial [Gemmatimonadaceae bacterium]